MRDLGTARMAELKFEAPLALEETDEWGGCEFMSSTNTGGPGSQIDNGNGLIDTINLNVKEASNNLLLLEEAVREVNGGGGGNSPNCNTIQNSCTPPSGENFTETFSGSLEDLVNTFDEKITKCFGNFEENVEDLAPVQVRSQEEIMSECQMWWTITGNFGNILPIDWSKSYARQVHIPSLNLEEKKNQINAAMKNEDLSSEDEAVANDLDMHALILNGLNPDLDEPIKSAEEVIKEIDDIMDEEEDPQQSIAEKKAANEQEIIEKAKEVLCSPLYEGKLESLSTSQLNELYMEMEILIKELSETLINELALRDELEYEKELKNSFICLLLAVQHKRRQYHVEKKRVKTPKKGSNDLEPKYLTTVIPYHLDSGAPDNHNLQVLIKILKAINEDSPTVPTLLTDYILKVICPT